MAHTLAQNLEQLLQTRPGHTAGQYAVMLDKPFVMVQRTLSRWERSGKVRKQLEFADKPYQAYSNQYIYYSNKSNTEGEIINWN